MKAQELALFCMQMYLLIESGVSANVGILIMSEEADDVNQKKIYKSIAENIDEGTTLSNSIKNTGAFPAYLVEMVSMGEETGNLDNVFKSLYEYYKRENEMAKTLKNVAMYPIIMIYMLLVVLFVLLVKVMPIFDDVYKQLGASISPIAKKAILIGGYATGISVAAISLMFVLIIGTLLLSKKRNVNIFEGIIVGFKEKSKLANEIAKSRLANVFFVSIKSGLSFEKATEMATKLIAQKKVKGQLDIFKDKIEEGYPLYESFKESKVFTGIDLQMIKIGVESGKTEKIFEAISERYKEKVDEAVENFIIRFEPTVVAVIGLAVGLILMAVMMPLVGIMASIG